MGLGPIEAGGLGNTTAFNITVNHIATFSGLNGFIVPDIRNIFQRGDIINIQEEGVAHIRMFFVERTLTATTMAVASTNGVALAVVGDA